MTDSKEKKALKKSIKEAQAEIKKVKAEIKKVSLEKALKKLHELKREVG